MALLSRVFGKAEAQYMRLGEATDSARCSRWLRLLAIYILSTTIYLVLLYAAYAAGKTSNMDFLSRAIHQKLVLQPFLADEAFIGRPTPDRERAWKSIFPEEGGFFVHPTLAPDKSVISVFHQLHCLEGIWHQWWMLYDEYSGENQTFAAADKNAGFHRHHHVVPDPVHVNHCIELLRLQLMCLPDLTVEIAKPDTGGVEGFGTVHQCWRWEDLMTWTGTWERYMLNNSKLSSASSAAVI